MPSQGTHLGDSKTCTMWWGLTVEVSLWGRWDRGDQCWENGINLVVQQ